ncbi:HAD-IA family hydrolase [Candidatus Gracilibacteria bacterium]|nr:HAD-IA family hydrolase [Candidatus Gracilibacteria bacterium]NJP17650.1 HAD-IA family hydrolase [Hydrococcus sp. CRU_1_1]
MTNQPKVIFLDAGGTLFGVKGSVGEIYGAIARQAGVEVLPSLLDEAFIQSFKASSSLAFEEVDAAKLSELEYQWWRAIAEETFAKAGVLECFSDFNAFFSQLYAYFATSEPWYVYPDVLLALQGWRQQGIPLGIISNFDSRIYLILESLQLADFFSSVTISSEAGSAKPQSQIFIAALKKHNCFAQEAWHIGDSLREDYQGAKAAGLKPFLIKRTL